MLTTVGSLGDLHPYLALAAELRRRGYRAVVATVPGLQDRVEASGAEFAPMRAATSQDLSAELIRRVFDGSRGVEYIFRRLILPALRTAYEDTRRAAEDADLLVAHPLTWATRLVAEELRLPWVSTVLAPASLLSATDPPLMPGIRWIHRLRFGPGAWRSMYRGADWWTRRWLRPYDALREELGLPDTGNPLFKGLHSPFLELAMFSPLLGAPQADWPRQTVATGFPFLDQAIAPDPELEAWLDAGSAPLVFTLGSSAVLTPGEFYRESALAARGLGRRALLLGAKPGEAGQVTGPDLFALAYGSYAGIFPRAAAVVHQGGVGTTAEALRAGVPMLVVPFGVDQPDNAARVVRLGVGRTLGRGSYRSRRVTRELRLLLERESYASRAREVAKTVGAECGTERACDAMEVLLEAALEAPLAPRRNSSATSVAPARD